MEEKQIILVVDDVSSNIQALAAVLKDDYQLKIATSGARALEIVANEPNLDLILLDVEMPEMDGYEVMQRLKLDDIYKDIPVIFVTGNDSVVDEEKGLGAGAVDYIAKPIRPAIVKARINTHITLKKQRDELKYNALHDRLTGLYNRYHLDAEGTRKFSRAKRHNDNFSVMMVDIDHFKAVNDNHGHLVGDEVLKAFARALNDSKRVEDFIARYGGEEFVVLYENCTINDAKEKAENLRKTIESLNPEGLKITSSFGIVGLDVRHENLEDMLKEADAALYTAKESGRNRVIVFKDDELLS